MKKIPNILLGSSPSLDGIAEVIKAYFYGDKPLEKEPDGTWSLHKSDGTKMERFVVRLHKGRYRFEQTRI